jgi:putative colanic acid biosynthesis glycosyltransferase
MSAPPIISIVVVSKNPGARLPAALASVWAQSDIAVDLVVVDGGSTDGTADWLEAQRSRIGTLIIEPDRGVYDAMNKGVAAARGEWVLFLGADDRLAETTTLRDVAHELARTDADIVAGEAMYEDGRVYRFSERTNPIARNFVHHQAAFYRRRLFAEHGSFDATLGIMGDYELNLRFRAKGVRFRALPRRVALCGRGGLSDAGRWRGYAEEIRVRHRYFSGWSCRWWDTASVARFLRKKLIRTFNEHG